MILKRSSTTATFLYRGTKKMKCPNCDAELIWGNDLDVELDDDEINNHCILSGFKCPDCPTEVEVYTYAKPI